MSQELNTRLSSLGFWLAVFAMIAAFILGVMGQMPWSLAGILMALGASRLL